VKPITPTLTVDELDEQVPTTATTPTSTTDEREALDVALKNKKKKEEEEEEELSKLAMEQAVAVMEAGKAKEDQELKAKKQLEEEELAARKKKMDEEAEEATRLAREIEEEQARQTKEELRKAAELARENVLKILKQSQERLEQSQLIAKHQESVSVPGIVKKLLRKVDAKLQAVVLKCGKDVSTCKEGLKQWNSLKNELLFNLENENDVNLRNLELAGVELDMEEVNDIKQSNLLATHAVIEVLTVELTRLTESFVIKYAQPISDFSSNNNMPASNNNPSSSRSSLFQRLTPSPLLEIAKKPLLRSAKPSSSGQVVNKEANKEEDLVTYVAQLVKLYCADLKKDGNSNKEEKLGKKKKSKKGGEFSPKPVNHPVLSSPLVLKASQDFHPKNANVSTMNSYYIYCYVLM
jgi:hypothetical protein